MSFDLNTLLPLLLMGINIILVFTILYLSKKQKTFTNTWYFLISSFLVILNIVVIASIKTTLL